MSAAGKKDTGGEEGDGWSEPGASIAWGLTGTLGGGDEVASWPCSGVAAVVVAAVVVAAGMDIEGIDNRRV